MTLKPKELVVIAGPNGAGKTAFAEEFLAQRPCTYLSADRIASQLAPDDPMSENVRAAREFVRRVGGHLAGSESLLVESTLSGRTFVHFLRKARERGVRSSIIFVFVDSAAVCIERIRQRVRKGGHTVPDSDVRRRFSRSLANVWHLYRPLADDWGLVYNGGSEFMDVAIGTRKEMAVRDEMRFQQFLSLTGADRNG